MIPFFKKDNVWLYQGDARNMDLIPNETIHLICTSIPYYNARPEYAEWETYTDYLEDMQKVWMECHRVMADGARIAINVPLGYSRTEYIPIGVDITKQLQNTFTLRGHIIWNKSNIGSTAWGSWLSANNPTIRDSHEIIVLAHKGNPSRLSTRNDKVNTINAQTFMDTTNSVWNILPESKSWHPAPWPNEIPRRLIELLTFENDIVLDPFAGSGTVGEVASSLNRRFVLFDINEKYIKAIQNDVTNWSVNPKSIVWQNCTPSEQMSLFGS